MTLRCFRYDLFSFLSERVYSTHFELQLRLISQVI
jgi:hypothetical protein